MGPAGATTASSPVSSVAVGPTAQPAATTPPTSARAALPTPEAGRQLTGQAAVDALRHGGYVLYFRHALTDQEEQDRDAPELADCKLQRNLSEAGRDQAREIGRNIERLVLPIGIALASPYCRTRDTAGYAFGHYSVNRDLAQFTINDTGSEGRITALRRILATVPAAGTDTVLVSHVNNFLAIGGVTLAEGEALLLVPDGSESFTIAGRIKPDEWATAK